MRRFPRFLAAAAVAAAPLGFLLSQDVQETALPDPSAVKSQKDVDRWMEVKLKSSQEVFAGLTNGDFDKVELSARRMQVLSLLEQWSLRRGQYAGRSDYEGQLNAFDYATKELVREAKERDIDGALEAYLNLSRSCVRCHKLVRDALASP